jgi:protein-tyrosine-phosphatase
MAEAYLKSLRVQNIAVLSSGVVADKYRSENEPRIPGIKAILAKHHVAQFAKDHPEQLTQERIDQGDVTICMNQIVADECNQQFVLPPNTQIWDINDAGEGHYIVHPGDDPLRYTEEIYGLITQRIDALVQSPGLATVQP